MPNRARIIAKALPTASVPEAVVNEIRVIPTGFEPDFHPKKDQLGVAVAEDGKSFWFYNSKNEWVLFSLSLHDMLEKVSLSNIKRATRSVSVPVLYTVGNVDVEGSITLKELKILLSD